MLYLQNIHKITLFFKERKKIVVIILHNVQNKFIHSFMFM
jgi:hypothetical protein